MAIRSALFLLWLTLSAAGAWAQDGPNRPEPKPLTLEGKSTAILVLDLNARCDDPKQVCSKITASLGDFLDKARAAAVPIVYTVSAAAKGQPIGELASPLRRKESERPSSIPTRSISSSAASCKLFSRTRAQKP